MRKIIIGIFIVSLFLNCGVKRVRKPVYKNYYEEALVNYFNTELKNRPDTFLKYFQETTSCYTEGYFLIAKSVCSVPCNHLLYSYGQIFQQDLTSLTDIPRSYEYDGGHSYSWYIVHDTTVFLSYIDSCKQVLSRDLDFKQKLNTNPIFNDKKPSYPIYGYIREKPQNRIKFIKKFYKDIYPNRLYLMISDIDIIYKTNIKQIFKFSGNRAFVNKKELYKVLSNCFPDE